MIGIVCPTRGLVFTEAVQGILDGFRGREYQIYFSHNLPTPESFNSLIKQAMDDGCDYIYITNDDVVVNKRIVDKLFEKCCDIVICPTYIGDFPGYYEKDGKITMCGTSCILAKREVFENIKPLDITRWIRQSGEEKTQGECEFGGEEVSFSKQVLAKGYTIEKIDDKTRHLRLIELGEHRSNHGCHRIEECE